VQSLNEVTQRYAVALTLLVLVGCENEAARRQPIPVVLADKGERVTRGGRRDPGSCVRSASKRFDAADARPSAHRRELSGFAARGDKGPEPRDGEKKPRESVPFYPILQPLGLMLLTLVVIGQQVLAMRPRGLRRRPA